MLNRDLERRVKRLESKLCCKSTVFYNVDRPRPLVGTENALYVDTDSGSMFLWDGAVYVSVGGGEPVFKVYKAFLTQTGTDAPVVTVLENTLGGAVVWTRSATGRYDGTLTGAFLENKVIGPNIGRFILNSIGDDSGEQLRYNLFRATDNIMILAVSNLSLDLTDINQAVYVVPIYFEVYP